jgi:hypothetical protein
VGRPGRSKCALCGMGKRTGITTMCPDCGRQVCERHLNLSGTHARCTRCAKVRQETPDDSPLSATG